MIPVILVVPALAAGLAIAREKYRKDRPSVGSVKQIPPILPSPIDGVSPGAWAAFVSLMRRGTLSHVTPDNRFGCFELNALQLQDLGLVKNAVKTLDKEGHSHWTCEWLSPSGQSLFLSDLATQYNHFARLMRAYSDVITERHSTHLTPVCSRSGMLAVARIATLGGLEHWLAEPDKRKAATSEEFRLANGVF